MKFQKFQAVHFEEYQSWYDEQSIKEHLGDPPDEAWLNYILKNKNGAQYTFFEARQMVGVMGTVFPDKIYPHFYITDIAVNPTLKRKGIGTKMLKALPKIYRLKKGQSYKAFVDIKNKDAQQFFSKLAWKLESTLPDKDEMLSFTSVY